MSDIDAVLSTTIRFDPPLDRPAGELPEAERGLSVELEGGRRPRLDCSSRSPRAWLPSGAGTPACSTSSSLVVAAVAVVVVRMRVRRHGAVGSRRDGGRDVRPADDPVPCIPFMYPDNGCWARAHEMCRRMVIDPAYISTGQDLAVYRAQLQARAIQVGPPPYVNCP